MRRVFIRILLVGLPAVMVLLASAATPSYAVATRYGDGSYGKCDFSEGCTNTVVETPQGLEVAINLSEGQVLPADGYTLRVTPLNGQGESFEYVEFYLDDVLRATFSPDQTGTATWFWDTAILQGRVVKIRVYDNGEAAITKTFNITIAKPGTQPVDPINNTGNPQNNGVAPVPVQNPIDQFFGFLENAIRALPVPLAVSIPYLLLLLLTIIITMLFMQSRHEAQESRRLRRALERARQLAEEKEGFIQLASHYLRTPLTLIKGGQDFFASLQPSIDSALLNKLSLAVNAFGLSIEALLDKASNDARLQEVTAASELSTGRPVWASAWFWLPLVLVGVLVVYINYLMVRTDKIDFSVLHVLTQVALYAALGIGLYMVIRWQRAVWRDRMVAEQQETQQVAIDEARNDLIRQAAATLAQKLQDITVVIPSLPGGQAKQFMQDGCARIQEVLRRFRETATVIPPVTSMPFERFRFNDILSQAQQKMSSAIESKRIKIAQVTDDVIMASQQPNWIGQVLGSVLDNAVAYSPQGGQIEVAAGVMNGRAQLVVQDHGTGIPEEKMAELFQPFSKAEGPLQFDHPGLGLSLYLDRLLLTNLSGDIRISSKPKQGTRVEITFPTRPD